MLKLLKSLFDKITSPEVASVNSHLEIYRQKMSDILEATETSLEQDRYIWCDN